MGHPVCLMSLTCQVQIEVGLRRNIEFFVNVVRATFTLYSGSELTVTPSALMMIE